MIKERKKLRKTKEWNKEESNRKKQIFKKEIRKLLEIR